MGKKEARRKHKAILLVGVLLIGYGAYKYISNIGEYTEYIEYKEWLGINEESLEHLSKTVKLSFKQTSDLYTDNYVLNVKVGDSIYNSSLLVEENKIVSKIIEVDSHIVNELNLGSVISQDFKTDTIKYLE